MTRFVSTLPVSGTWLTSHRYLGTLVRSRRLALSTLSAVLAAHGDSAHAITRHVGVGAARWKISTTPGSRSWRSGR